MNDDFMSKNFGITPVLKQKNELINKELNDDFILARKNLLFVIETGSHAIEELNDLACASQHTKYYEALNATLKTMVDANKALLNIRKEAVEIDKERPKQQNVTNQNLFVGSTAELLRMLQEVKKLDDEQTS